jgi:hypothetical protein
VPVSKDDLFLFDLQGYLVLRNILTANEIAQINAVLDRNLTAAPGAALADQVFQHFLAWDSSLRALTVHPRVMDLVRLIVDERPRLDRYYGLRMLPGTNGVPLHGGAKEVDDQSEYYAVMDGVIRNGITTVSWALADMLPEHGCFACIPGSHKSGLPLPNSSVAEQALQHVPLRAGDVVVFTSAVAHRGPVWRGPHERRSLLFKYAPRHIAWSRQYLSWPAELLAALTPEERALFAPPHCFEGPDIGVG